MTAPKDFFGPQTTQRILGLLDNEYQPYQEKGRRNIEQNLEQTPISFRNDSGEQIPPFACMKITDTIKEGGKLLRLVSKPNNTGGPFLFNDKVAVDNGSRGRGFLGAVRALMKSGETPQVEYYFGPTNSWEVEQAGEPAIRLHGDESFVTVAGQEFVIGDTRVPPDFVVDLAQTAGSAGDVDNQCTFIYNIAYPHGQTIASNVSPVAAPNRCRRHGPGECISAQSGGGYWENGQFVLSYFNEKLSTDGCESVGGAALMGGTADSMVIDTTKRVVQNYQFDDDGGIPYDKVAGTVTLPQAGWHTVNMQVVGAQGNNTKDEEMFMHLRIANTATQDGDYLIWARDVASNQTSSRSFSGIFSIEFEAGATLSIVMDATADMGTFTFVSTNFEVIRRSVADTPLPIDLKLNMVHAWDLNSGAATMNDRVGSANASENGTVSTATGLGPNSQDVSQFGGSGNNYEVSSFSPISYYTGFTYMQWIRMTTLQSNSFFAHRATGGNPAYLWVRYNAGNIEVRLFDSGQTVRRLAITSGVTFSANTWYFLTVTGDASDLKVYVDTVERATNSDALGTANTAATKLLLCDRFDGVSSGGHIGESMSAWLYSEVKDQAFINEAYNGGNGWLYDDLP